MSIKTYYELLELTIEAMPQQIKANYRRLAKKYHPDLNPDNPKAVEQFRAVHEAYETLSDPEKRRAYDSTLKPKNGYSNTAHDSDEDDWFGFGATAAASVRPQENGTRQTNRRSMSRAHQPRQAYLNYTVHLTLRELFKGAKRTLTIGQTHTCGKCRGARVLRETGKTCPRCDGFGFLVSYEVVEVTIPPAVTEGMAVRLEMSHWSEEKRNPLHVPYSTGIFVTISVLPDSVYRVDGRDLYTTVNVPADLLEAGGDWTLPAPEGGEIVIKIPAHTPNGETIKVKKQGLFNGASQRRGTLFCTVLAKN